MSRILVSDIKIFLILDKNHNLVLIEERLLKY